ncbi:hypothetical protein BGZ76_005204 [Entomortierella beljakovae]|nr:hypothetical protein BGZ76_005204 [Entomortierella beljakovae]
MALTQSPTTTEHCQFKSNALELAHSGCRDFTRVREVLSKYYKPHLVIQRVSGKKINLEEYFINLDTVEVDHQRRNDPESFIRLENHEKLRESRAEPIISAEDLFSRRRLRDGRVDIPKKILIEGRAGIGKSTLCKKLVHLLINGSWSDRFEASRNLEKLLKTKYFAHHHSREKSALVNDILDGIQLNKVLFILDGLDEILHDAQSDAGIESFLTELLRQTHVIITTRPTGVDSPILPTLDLKLETVGFGSRNIGNYVNNVLDEKSAKSVLDFIQQTPVIQSLASTPIQLDAICYSWKSLPKDEDAITISKIYQGMIDKLWRRDGIRLEKSDINITQMNNIQEYQVKRLMSLEMEFLSYLAFQGIRANQFEFDRDTLNSTLSTLDHLYPNQDHFPYDFLDKVTKTSFLHTTETNIDHPHHNHMHQSWHFAHLTFQDFFAATWFARHFHASQNQSKDQCSTFTWEEIKSFIQQNKYDPRYEIVWQMLSGQLDGDGLNSFFEILCSEPKDLIGVQHVLLLSGCYRESVLTMKEQLIEDIETEIARILHIDIEIYQRTDNDSLLGSHQLIPDRILISRCFRTDKEIEYTLKALQHRPFKTSKAIRYLINLFESLQNKLEVSIVKALETQSTLPVYAIECLVLASTSQDKNLRSSAVTILGGQPFLPSSAIQSLINSLKDGSSRIRSSAAYALGGQFTLQSSAIPSLVDSLRDENWHVSSSAAKALGSHSKLPLSAIMLLIDALRDRNEDVRLLAAKVLGSQSTLPSSAIPPLLDAVQDKIGSVRTLAVKALGRQSILPSSAIPHLIDSLKDEDWHVRSSAAKALSRQLTLPSFVILPLIDSLEDDDPRVRSAAAEAIGSRSILPSSAVTPLINSLKDKSARVRSSAAKALGIQSTLPASAIPSLIGVLRDESCYVRSSAAKVRGSQATFPSLVTLPLTDASEDIDLGTGSAVVEVLRTQSNLSSLTTLPHNGLFEDTQRHLDIQMDKNDSVNCSNTTTVGVQSTSNIPSLIKTLKDKGEYVRLLAAEVLGSKPTLPPSAIQPLVDALKDKDEYVRLLAAEVLGSQSTLPPSVIQPLIDALKDRNYNVRSAAVEALGNQSKLPLSAISPLIDSLKDRNFIVRSAAVDAFRNQSTIPSSAIQPLVDTLMDRNECVRSSGAKALENLPKLHPSSIPLLIDALRDSNIHVRRSAARLLANQPEIPINIMFTLIEILGFNCIDPQKISAFTLTLNMDSVNRSL